MVTLRRVSAQRHVKCPLRPRHWVGGRATPIWRLACTVSNVPTACEFCRCDTKIYQEQEEEEKNTLCTVECRCAYVHRCVSRSRGSLNVCRDSPQSRRPGKVCKSRRAACEREPVSPPKPHSRLLRNPVHSTRRPTLIPFHFRLRRTYPYYQDSCGLVLGTLDPSTDCQHRLLA